MKRKEFLQKSAVIAAVTLAAAVMEPGAVHAADIPDQEISAQVLDQSEEDTSSTVDTSETSDEQVSDETADSESDVAQETDPSTSEESSDTETTEDTASSDDVTVSDTETTVDTSEVSDNEISSSSEISDAEADDPNAETSKTNDETAAQLQTPGWTTREDGTTGYQNEDGSLCADTIKEIDGKLYYFNEDGSLVKDAIFQYGYDYYKASEDGSLYRSCWDGDSYYDQDGKQQRDCIIELDGKHYYFDEDGILYKNITLIRYEEDADGNDIKVCYRAKENGELYTGWCRIYSNELYYFDETGRGYDGIKTIDGQTYFFDDARLCVQQKSVLPGMVSIITVSDMKIKHFIFLTLMISVHTIMHRKMVL